MLSAGVLGEGSQGAAAMFGDRGGTLAVLTHSNTPLYTVNGDG